MKITKKYLEKIKACKPAITFWGANGKPNNLKEAFNLLIKKEKLDYANWFVCQLMTHKQRVQYSIFAARQVIDIFEKKYPNDKRPRAAIEATEKYFKNPSKKNKDAAVYATYAAANAAANAAYAAVYATYAAVYAAANAANAAYAAVYATYAAANAAAYAAYVAANAAANAAYAAANAAAKLKIIKYGLRLLKIKL